jgi:uncharacterized protein
MLASKTGSPSLITLFLNLHPNPLELLAATDCDGNTALHFASGYGHLKCLRVLLTAGADPMAENNFRCTPSMGSRTKEAGSYFLSLVREIEVRKIEGREREKEMVRRREGGVRIVSNSSTSDDTIENERDRSIELEQPPGAVFGSVDSSGRATPTRMRQGWAFGQNRGRAGSSE